MFGVAIHPERFPLVEEQVQPGLQLVQHLLVLHNVDGPRVIESNPEVWPAVTSTGRNQI